MNRIDFLLVPDRYSARYLRRVLTNSGTRLGLVVGTFNELLERVRHAYMIGRPPCNWQEDLLATAMEMPEAFWHDSLVRYPREAGATLVQTMTELLEGTFPKKVINPRSTPGMSDIARGHLEDLIRLFERMGEGLPSHLATAKAILGESAGSGGEFHVYYHPEAPDILPWQRAVIEKINIRSGLTPDAALETLFKASTIPFCLQHTRQAPCIRHLASRLFSSDAATIPFDGSLQWIATRDYLEEAEVAAGQIQTLLQSTSGMRPSDLALLLPSDPRYGMAIKDVFAKAGLPLSGIGGSTERRDLGREVLFHFLIILQKPAAVMAWAALLTSPLMPWSPAMGHIMAQKVVGGDFNMDHMPVKNGRGREILELLQKDLSTAAPQELAAVLQQFERLLDFRHVDLEDAGGAFLEGITGCLAQIRQSKEINWSQLCRAVIPEKQSLEWEDAPNLEGIAVFQENSEPWRLVKHLFVLGFGEGHYPRGNAHSPVFTDRDLEALNRGAGVSITTAAKRTAKNRELFKRQLGSASDSVTFLFSRKAPMGDTLQSSASMPFIFRLFSDMGSPDQEICEVDRAEDRSRIRWLKASAPVPAQAPKEIAVNDLDLGIDLLKIHHKEDGSLREQSPSRLANLMTAPLAWLLDWVDIAPLEWGLETLDPATKGTIAHAVFEHLFPPDTPLPGSEDINALVPGLLHTAIRDRFPYLQSKEWKIERANLESDIVKAALQWRELLFRTGIRVIGNEIKLFGEMDGVPLKGFADVILVMPDGRIIVGDYKKSKSDKRKKQMARGYDSQASLYRTMIETGRINSKREIAMPEGLSGDRIGVLYYTLNDQVVLTDTTAWMPKDPLIKELGSDIAHEAMALIKQRLEEVRSGRVTLNSEDDEKTWDDRGIMMYCLDNSPLLRMFMHPGEVK